MVDTLHGTCSCQNKCYCCGLPRASGCPQIDTIRYSPAGVDAVAVHPPPTLPALPQHQPGNACQAADGRNLINLARSIYGCWPSCVCRLCVGNAGCYELSPRVPTTVRLLFPKQTWCTNSLRCTRLVCMCPLLVHFCICSLFFSLLRLNGVERCHELENFRWEEEKDAMLLLL